MIIGPFPSVEFVEKEYACLVMFVCGVFEIFSFHMTI